LYSYSIKPIARFIGFNWTSKDAGGAQSMLWYSNWLQSKDEKLLNKIIQYNKEDCIATRKVKEWLEKL
ncbi:MAG: ribonuclease H-like domain-containing protein, partial [Nanoarchaeota archaeon]|nr:ribonuclease H-like domain-containing protein [Nanoarchaeota archaeon]